MWTDTVVTHSAIHCSYGIQKVEKLLHDEVPTINNSQSARLF